MKNEEARKTFELLAKEEREHAEWFWKIYPGDDIPDFDAFMAALPKNSRTGSPIWRKSFCPTSMNARRWSWPWIRS